jgi:nucleoside-diphosphate-sugar epimerase
MGSAAQTQLVEALEEELSCPTEADCAFLRSLPGDILILGAAGKMGPSLARRARRAADLAGNGRRVFAVSRFASRAARDLLESWGIETIACDLLDRAQLASLPDCPNILFLAGRKFGSRDNTPLTWATNVLLPAWTAERFAASRIVVLSSGNVYPLVSQPADEATPPAPIGEYAQSVLGRERVFEYFSGLHSTPVALLRLNYAIDLRYGVLLDIGQRVFARRPVPLAMRAVNVIWQGDANSIVLRALGLAASPPLVLNVTGPQSLSMRWIAGRFAERFGIAAQFEGVESDTALLSDSSLSTRLLGAPPTSPEYMIDRVADWIRAGGPTLDKPTRFEVRDGAF